MLTQVKFVLPLLLDSMKAERVFDGIAFESNHRANDTQGQGCCQPEDRHVEYLKYTVGESVLQQFHGLFY